MPSVFAWIDDSEKQRQRVHEALDVFTVRGTRDELGLSVIRDAFSDLLFPATGALQTRAAYFLFVPWMYRALELEGVRSADIARIARKRELALVAVLLASGDTVGVIGRVGGAALKRLPSSIYWTGLGRLGIRRFPSTQDAYHRSLDAWHRRRRAIESAEDDGQPASMQANWHAGIPEPPSDWPAKATLRLRPVDAQYLRECIRTAAGDSLLARMDGFVHAGERAPFPWDHPVVSELALAEDPLSRSLFRQLAHARCFSEIMNGAAILYNLIVAEQLPGGSDLTVRYQTLMTEWHEEIEARMDAFRTWDLDDLWRLMADARARVHPRARDFVAAWVSLARSSQFKADTIGPAARRLVSIREKSLKGPLARIDNAAVQERWEGDSGLGRFEFRWTTARVILADIGAALAGDTHAGTA